MFARLADSLITSLSHGRDNKIHVYPLPADPSSTTDSIPPSLSNPTPLEPLYSLDVNALTYCRFSLLPLATQEAYIAVPATLQDELIDVYHLPSRTRISRSIGAGLFPINDKTGTTMALQLVKVDERTVRLVAAYEDGRVAIFERVLSTSWSTQLKDESEGWALLYAHRAHKEPSKCNVLSLLMLKPPSYEPGCLAGQ
jgi:hypothetical protein